MDRFILSQDMETGKYYLLENHTGLTKAVFKNGEYIKKFHLSMTGKANYDERVQTAQGDPAYMPFSTSAMKRFPEFYIPQPDKFDSYAQLPRTLQDPYVNNDRKRPQTTLEETRKLLAGNSMNDKHGVIRPISYITGTAKDQYNAQQTGAIQVLQTRHETKTNNYVTDGAVKLVNNKELTKPNMTLFKPYKARGKSVSEQQLQQQESLKQSQTSQIPQIPQNTLNKYQSGSIVPLDDKQLESIKSLNLLKSLQNDTSQKIQQFQCQTYNQSQPQLKRLVDDSSLQLKRLCDFEQKLEITKKELQTFQLPLQRIQQKVTSKGRFNVHVATNKEQYNEARDMMKLYQPELFVVKENPKKIELEKQRKILARMKEKEMLQHNLNNKL